MLLLNRARNYFDSTGYALFFLFFLINVNKAEAQNAVQAVINSTGNTYTQKNEIIFEWSVGELAVIETMVATRAIITNGLLQPVLPSQFITEGFSVLATNLLSPNGDGKNDTWIVKDIEKYPDNEVIIFDRSGRVVFQTKNYQNNWNGYLSGLPLKEDTYYYSIKLKKDGKTGLVRGFITILN